MARKQARPQPLQHVTLGPLQTICRAVVNACVILRPNNFDPPFDFAFNN